MKKIIIIVFCIAFALGQFARVQLGDVGITALDIVVFVISLVTLIRVLFKNQLRGDIYKYSGLFLISGLLGLVLNSPNLEFHEVIISFLYLIRLILYGSIYFWVRSFTLEERQFTLNLLVGSGIFIVIVGFIQFFYYPDLRNLYYLGWDDHLYRLFSVFFDPNFAGAFLVLFILFLVDLLRHKKDKISQSMYGVIISLSIFAVFLTHSRTGFIMLVVGSLFYLIKYVSKRVAVVVCGVLLLILLITSNTGVEGLNPLRTASSQARVDSAHNAIKIFQSKPIFGVGLNTYRYAQVNMGLRQENLLYTSHADAGTDNSYLFVLATTGIVGGIFFVLFWRKIVMSTLALARVDPFPSRSFVSGLIAILVGSLFLNIIFYPMILLWMVIQAGLIRSK